MTNLLVIKEQLVGFYSRFETYIVAVLKFLVMLMTMLIINANIGYMTKLDNGAIVLIVALLCSFLPSNLIVVISAGIIMLHMYSLSLETAAVVGMIFVIMFVLYFRFTPRDALAVILTPICFMLKIPYVVPFMLGFVGTPMSCVSVGCGVVVYYMLEFVRANESQLMNSSKEIESMLSGFKYIIDGLISNDEMLLVVITFGVVVIAVFMIKSLPIDYSWYIALGMGVVLNILVMLIGCSALDVDMSIAGVIFGTLVSAIIVFIFQFFVFNVDYSRTENVQFEDDEYYYYVKAVPKMSVEAPQVSVKRINPRDDDYEDDEGDYLY